MRNKKGYQIIQPIANEERFSNYYCCYVFWVAVGYYLWKKILSITGYRFHPTDFELLHYYLRNKNLGRDALVQAIAEVEDICGLEPWELPGHSNIHSGDQVWYFFNRPSYKYRNSTRIKRTTNEGYWKPTGNPRKIMARDLATEIGKKRTLVFYKGRVSDNNKNKTGWIMHEYELAATLPNQNTSTFVLCKLKRKFGNDEVPCIEEAQSSHYLPPNLGNYIANNANQAEAARFLTDQSGPNEILERLEVLDDHEGLDYQSTECWDSYLVGYFPNNEGSGDLPSDFGNHVAENAIPNDQSLTEVPVEQVVPQDQSGTEEQDSKFGNLVPAADGWTMPSNSKNATTEDSVKMDQSLTEVPVEQVVPQDQSDTEEQDSKFGNLVPAAEGSMMPSNSKNATTEDSVKMDLSNSAGPSTDEVFAELEALPEVQGNRFGQVFYDWILVDGEIFLEQEIPNASDNQSSTNEDQNLTAPINGGFSLSSAGMMAYSPHAISPSRKRSRTDHEGVGFNMKSHQG